MFFLRGIKNLLYLCTLKKYTFGCKSGDVPVRKSKGFLLLYRTDTILYFFAFVTSHNANDHFYILKIRLKR